MANENLKRTLKERGIKQYEVAARMGVGESRLSKMLRTELTPEQRSRFEKAVKEVTEEKMKCLKTGIG